MPWIIIIIIKLPKIYICLVLVQLLTVLFLVLCCIIMDKILQYVSRPLAFGSVHILA